MMFKNFIKDAAFSACLVSMLMRGEVWGMTTGKHVTIEWTEEEAIMVSYAKELLREVEKGDNVNECEINEGVEFIEYLIEPLQDSDPLVELKRSKLEQLKKCLENSKIS